MRGLGGFVARKLPSIGALLIGIMVGLIWAQYWGGGRTESAAWSGAPARALRPNPLRSLGRSSLPTPSEEQRFRVLELLTTLSAHHTKECTREARASYGKQAHERYAPLVGHQIPRSKSFFSGWGSGGAQSDARWGSSFGDADMVSRAVVRRDLSNQQHKYFFAINLYNSFDVIPDLFATLFRVSAILGYHNVFVSIYENGSTDQTKALLRLFDALARSTGLRIVIRTSMRTRGAFNHRIEYLAEVRNAAMLPLHELRDSEGEVFDTVIFMNDILPCVDDVLELIWQSRRQNAGITCAADYMFHDEIGAPVFYDNWVARDLNGTALENAPFEGVFRHEGSSYRFQKHLPIQVQSCWNGIAILDPAPLYAAPHVRFRMAKISDGECSASECGLICNDYWNAGYGRIIMVPRVKLAYDKKVFDIIHPDRKNLTSIRGYKKIGGIADDPTSDPQDKSWYGPHDRLFVAEESEEINFKQGPSHVWCWGWDGAGDLDGPDVDPIWEKVTNNSAKPEAVRVRHDRSFL